MVSEEQKKEYQDYVKEITPTHNTPKKIYLEHSGQAERSA